MLLFNTFGQHDSIGKAIECCSLAATLTPDNHPNKPEQLSSLGNMFASRFQTFGRHSDINQAVKHHLYAVALASDRHPHRATLLGGLGNTYELLFATFGRQDDIDKAIDYLKLAVILAPDGHPDRPLLLCNLGTTYLSLFQTSSKQDDVCTAVRYLNQALTLIPEDDLKTPDLLNNLGKAHFLLFQKSGERDDIDKAVDCFDRAVVLTPDGHTSKPMRLSNLGSVYGLMYKTFDRQGDANKAIKCFSSVVALTPEGHPVKPTGFNGLGTVYFMLFHRSGRRSDIDKAIEYINLAITFTPNGHPSKPGHLYSLGHTHTYLFREFRRQHDIDKAIESCGLAVALAPGSHPDKPKFLKGLGLAYRQLFMKSRKHKDISKAIEYFDLGVELVPDGHSARPAHLNELGIAHGLLFDTSGRQPDLDKQTECFTLAVALTPDDNQNKPSWLHNLGRSYSSRFKLSGRQSDIDKAIECLGRAIVLAPDNHPMKVLLLNSLGQAYSLPSQPLPPLSPSSVLKSLSAFKDAVMMLSGHASIRLMASCRWADLAALSCESTLEARTRSMQLLPEVIWLGGSVEDRYSVLEGMHGLVSDAVADAITMQEYDTASEWLEQGRCMVWAQLLELRTPLDDLRNTYPELAEELQQLSRLLEYSPMSSSDEATLDVAQKHRQWTEAREERIELIRQLDGFHEFLRPAKLAKLATYVNTDAVVVVNVSIRGCGALIIRSGAQRVEHVPLPGFTYEQAAAARTELVGQHSRDAERKIVWHTKEPDMSIEDILHFLWHGVAHPVLTHLGISHELPIDELPHIVWCVTGPLSFLPIHAAGDYSTGRANTILHNLVVSSYTPNLSALNHSVTAPAPFSGMLAVGVASPVRNAGPLVGVKRELSYVQRRFDGLKCTRLDDASAQTDVVLQAMANHSWVHFACHASQHDKNPLESAFRLFGGDLDLSAISRTHLPHADFAFLSACLTATGDAKLPDETVHLAAGLLMAGYRSVIASIWPIYDKHAPVVAEKVYEHMMEGGIPDSRKAARALHKAIAHLRELVGVEKYNVWVPYIHMGC